MPLLCPPPSSQPLWQLTPAQRRALRSSATGEQDTPGSRVRCSGPRLQAQPSIAHHAFGPVLTPQGLAGASFRQVKPLSVDILPRSSAGGGGGGPLSPLARESNGLDSGAGLLPPLSNGAHRASGGAGVRIVVPPSLDRARNQSSSRLPTIPDRGPVQESGVSTVASPMRAASRAFSTTSVVSGV